MQEKEYILKCTCGARYRFQGTEKELEDILESQTWMCKLGNMRADKEAEASEDVK